MAPAASAAEVKMYRRMADWYDRPECDALRAAWGPYPATPAALQSWASDFEGIHGRPARVWLDKVRTVSMVWCGKKVWSVW